MRIATFNLESLDEGPKAEVALEARVDILRPQLERLEADVLCLQEVNGQHVAGVPERRLHALDQLLRGTRYEAFSRVATLGASGVGVADVHNLVILSRWPITASRQVRNDIVPALSYSYLTAVPKLETGASLGFERPFLLAEVHVAENFRVHVLNVHLRAPLAAAVPGQKDAPFVWRSTQGWAEGFLISAWKRSAQALEARLAVDSLLDENLHAAVVVAGDFNAEDHEVPLKILAAAEEDTGNGRLAQRSLVLLDRAIAEDRRFSLLHHGRPQMLDHILASRAMLGRFRSIEVHNETLGDELIGFGKTRRAAGSFHAPVVAEFAD